MWTKIPTLWWCRNRFMTIWRFCWINIIYIHVRYDKTCSSKRKLPLPIRNVSLKILSHHKSQAKEGTRQRTPAAQLSPRWHVRSSVTTPIKPHHREIGIWVDLLSSIITSQTNRNTEVTPSLFSHKRNQWEFQRRGKNFRVLPWNEAKDIPIILRA